jgi:pilus assembly protein CpaF
VTADARVRPLPGPAALPAADAIGALDYSVVAQLRERVAVRLAEDERRYATLTAGDRRQLTVALIQGELESWLLQQAAHGRAAPTAEVEDRLVAAVHAELDGLGRLQPLLLREDVEDIFIEGCDPVKLRLLTNELVEGPQVAATDADLVLMLQNLASRAGQTSREFSAASPLLNLRLPVGVGARLAAEMAVVPRPRATIRIHRFVDIDLEDLHRIAMIDSPLRAFLRAGVLAGLNVLISGPPRAGKTTLLRALANEVPAHEHIVTVEDDYELGIKQLTARHPLVTNYETRLENAEGRGGIDMSMLLKQTLRDSPDRLLVGEVRGGESVHLLNAMSNGIAGAMCTLHADRATDVFTRIGQTVLQHDPPMPIEFALQTAATAIDLIVHVDRDPRTHMRFVREVAEVGPIGDNGQPSTTHLFAAEAGGRRGVPTEHQPSPRLAERLEAVGFDRSWLRSTLSDWPELQGVPG